VEEGATGLVLYGWSVGATMALLAADRSHLRGAVRGLVLDSPILDWQLTLRRRAAALGVPGPLLPLGVRACEGRTGLHGNRLAQAANPRTLNLPTLILHGPDDTIAPWQPSRELADARPDRVVLHSVSRAEHAAMWNADPDYPDVVRRFLVPLV
jgi:pimeloyl-ACP methyl ester carboxylesterase